VDAAPLISIVMATYNRSNLLRYSIGSLQRQTLTDWELLVIGDACTDNTATVVATFADPRIRYHNLPQNIGEQSGPNNVGVQQARGRYIAFLNHDDLWFPQHLEAQVAQLEREAADLVFSLGVFIAGDGSQRLTSADPSGEYRPEFGVPATCWLFRRELAERVGPWRFYQELYDPPSMDWLHRAWRSGARMRLTPQLTAVIPTSATRKNSYADRDETIQRQLFERMHTDPDSAERLLTELLVSSTVPDLRIWNALLRAAGNLIKRTAGKFGLRPAVVAHVLLKGWRRGAAIDGYRRTRGLPPLARRNRSHAV
jgi:glycosyltransferase involved in cell wall biosynthesis